MPTKLRLAWDSTIILDALEQSAGWWDHIRPMYEDAKAGLVEIVVSEISVAECCKLRGLSPDARPTLDAAAKLVRDFFSNPYILRRPADRRESALAADYIRDHGLETCDAIIAATAVLHHAHVLYSRDGMKKRRKSKPSILLCDGKLGTPPMAIRPPSVEEYAKLASSVDLYGEGEDGDERLFSK